MLMVIIMLSHYSQLVSLKSRPWPPKEKDEESTAGGRKNKSAPKYLEPRTWHIIGSVRCVDGSAPSRKWCTISSGAG